MRIRRLADVGDEYLQTNPTVRVTRTAVVHETPRGDSVRVASAQPGDIYKVLGRRENWLLVTPPDDVRTSWLRGWIHLGSVEVVSGSLDVGARPRLRGPFMVAGSAKRAHDFR